MAKRNQRRRARTSKKARKRSGWFGKLFKIVLVLTLLAGLVGAGGVAGLFYYYGRDLPALLDRDDYQPKQMSRVHASDGAVIAELVVQGGRRTVLPLQEIPVNVRYAFMAAEDADFMIHEGIDYLGMIRAFYYAIFYDAGLKGTSTITQQVIKNLVLTPERRIERKIKEIILARELEKNLSKEDILYLYLNEIYLGHGNHGVQEASLYYFGKPAAELRVHEAAVLAGITQSPERLSPKKHPERALKRRAFVLRQLWEKGFIEEATYRAADDQPLQTVPFSTTFPHLGEAPFFVEYVRKRLIERYGEEKVYTGGMAIFTTLDLEKQRAAISSLRAGLRTYDSRHGYYRPKRKLPDSKIDAFLASAAAKLGEKGLSTNKVYEAVVTAVDVDTSRVDLRIADARAHLIIEPRSRLLGAPEPRPLDEVLQPGHVLSVTPISTEPDDSGTIPCRFEHGPEAALVSIDPQTRDVVAMTGGYDFDHKKFDHASQANRQTGSTFKPFVYGAAIEQKLITPATIYLDSPSVFKLGAGKSWSPKNSDGRWRGPIRIREGLGASRNVVAVRVLKDVGIEAAQQFSRRLGIRSPLVDNFTMVMGSSEITPLEMTNAYATLASGGLFAEPRFLTHVETAAGETDHFESRAERVLAPEVAFLITDLLTAGTMGYVDSEGKRRGGTAASLNNLGRPIAGKTGTTNEARDAWFIGYTPQYVAGAWVGFDNNRSLGNREYGGRVAGPIWRDYMQAVHEGLEAQEFAPPSSGITRAAIDPATGKLARQGGVEEVFLSGTSPTEYAPAPEQSDEGDFLMQQFGSTGD